MAKIVCESCGSSFPVERVKDMKDCPVCGESLLNDDTAEIQKETTKWYYYKEGGGMLDDTLSSHFNPLYTFDAVDVEDAKRQLKEVLPNSPLVNNNSPDIVRCPRCRSTQVQMVPRKFSLSTGFATNRLDRVCVKCQKRF
ncbi:MAG: hypothetical protein NC312_09205 [Bacteroides fragilis]|nr:hypothetical protein [Bacteroides fragilis]